MEKKLEFSKQNKVSVLTVVDQELMIQIMFRLVHLVEAQAMSLKDNKLAQDSINKSKLNATNAVERERFSLQNVTFAKERKLCLELIDSRYTLKKV